MSDDAYLAHLRATAPWPKWERDEAAAVRHALEAPQDCWCETCLGRDASPLGPGDSSVEEWTELLERAGRCEIWNHGEGPDIVERALADLPEGASRCLHVGATVSWWFTCADCGAWAFFGTRDLMRWIDRERARRFGVGWREERARLLADDVA